MGKDGFPDMRAGGHGVTIAVMMGRGAKMAASQASMQELAETLANQLGRPVVDQTGLTGKYEFEVYFSMEGLAMPPPPPGAPWRLRRVRLRPRPMASRDQPFRRRSRSNSGSGWNREEPLSI